MTPTGAEVAAFPVTEVVYVPNAYTIQIGPHHHAVVPGPYRYMDHSFNPSVEVRCEHILTPLGGRERMIRLIALRDIHPGDAITFDYNSTEYQISAPFVDYETGDWVRGYRFLSDEERAAMRWLCADFTGMWHVHYEEYRTKGATLLWGHQPASACREWAKWVNGQALQIGHSVNGVAPMEDNHEAPWPPDVADEQGLYKYRYLDSMQLYGLCPDLRDLYNMTRLVVGRMTREAVIASPYHLSQTLGISYANFGDQQGYHRDTQPITALLYLTACEGGDTVLTTFDGKERRIRPEVGKLLIMQGRHVRHASAPVTRGTKAVLAMNFYVEGDLWRPESLDDPDYWKHPDRSKP